MNLENIAKEAKKIKIDNDASFCEADNYFIILKAEAENILTHITEARHSLDKKQIFALGEHINSRYLKTLAETLEMLEDKIENYASYNGSYIETEQETQYKIENRIFYVMSNEMDISDQLFMYSSYLKSRKDPQVLNPEEIKRVKRHPINRKSFQMEISEKKYKKMNDNLDNIQYHIIPKIIITPFKVTGNILKYFGSKVDAFFDQYKYNASGTYEEYLMEKNRKTQG